MKTRFLSVAHRLRRPVTSNHQLVSILVALLPAAGMAAGETVPCPEKRAGQWYRFAKADLYNKRTEFLTKIERVDGDRLFINRDGVTLITDKMHNWHEFGKFVATPKYYSGIECPFSLGEKRIYKDVDYDALLRPGWKAHATFTVTVDQELVAVTVKAGSFKAVKIVSEESVRFGSSNVGAQIGSGGSGSGRAQTVSYYVPELGIAVKGETLWSLPWGPTMTRDREGVELLEYSLAN